MSAPEDGLLAAAAEYQRCAADLREVIREGRELMRDMRDARRELDAAVVAARKAIATAANDDVNAVVKKHLDALHEELGPFQAKVLRMVDEHWRRYTDLLMGRARETRRPGELPIDEIAGMIADSATNAGLPSVIGEVPAAFDRSRSKRPVSRRSWSQP